MGRILIIKGVNTKPATGDTSSSLPSTGKDAVDAIYYRGPEDYYYRDKQAALDAGGVYAVFFSFFIDTYTSKKVSASPIDGFTTVAYAYNKRNTDAKYELHELGFVQKDGCSSSAAVTLTIGGQLKCGWIGFGKARIFDEPSVETDAMLSNIEILSILQKFKGVYKVEVQ